MMSWNKLQLLLCKTVSQVTLGVLILFNNKISHRIIYAFLFKRINSKKMENYCYRQPMAKCYSRRIIFYNYVKLKNAITVSLKYSDQVLLHSK